MDIYNILNGDPWLVSGHVYPQWLEGYSNIYSMTILNKHLSMYPQTK